MTRPRRSRGERFSTRALRPSSGARPSPRRMLLRSMTRKISRPGSATSLLLTSGRRRSTGASVARTATSSNASIVRGLPSTVRMKSSAVRPVTGRPSLSTTIASTVTRSTPARNTGSCACPTRDTTTRATARVASRMAISAPLYHHAAVRQRPSRALRPPPDSAIWIPAIRRIGSTGFSYASFCRNPNVVPTSASGMKPAISRPVTDSLRFVN